MQDVFSWHYDCRQSATFRLHSVHPCVHRISEVGERFKPFSVDGGTVEWHSPASNSTLTTDCASHLCRKTCKRFGCCGNETRFQRFLHEVVVEARYCACVHGKRTGFILNSAVLAFILFVHLIFCLI